MSEPDNGGPAFPFQVDNSDHMHHPEFGMSLRDYFAGQALIGILSNPAVFNEVAAKKGRGPSENIAAMSVIMADAMLEARKAK